VYSVQVCPLFLSCSVESSKGQWIVHNVYCPSINLEFKEDGKYIILHTKGQANRFQYVIMPSSTTNMNAAIKLKVLVLNSIGEH
jgi:hypothetical protein